MCLNASQRSRDGVDDVWCPVTVAPDSQLGDPCFNPVLLFQTLGKIVHSTI